MSEQDIIKKQPNGNSQNGNGYLKKLDGDIN